jgi:two-component system CheB/CheR fusion protein
VIDHLGNGQWEMPALHRLFETVLAENNECQDYEVTHTFPSLGPKVLILNARRFDNVTNLLDHILLPIEDATDCRRASSSER